MDHTSSEEGKQPAKENGIPSQFSAGDDRDTSARSEQDRDSESARRAFDLLERFSGELEEILRSLERARSNTTSAENSPQAPEQALRPSSIHFDSSPISTRIDPYALPPVQSPGATSRPAPRILLEVLFLILVAAISAQAHLRWLLIIAAEVVAFLIVASVEFAIAHDKRRYQQLPASAPAFASLLVQETGATSEPLSVTLDQVEPLVWQADRQEDGAEANWPLAEFEPQSEPDEAEDTGEAQEGSTEISTALHAEGGVAAAPVPAPEVRSEAASESAMEIPATETEGTFEIPAPEAEPEHQRRFGLFRHETSEPGSAAEPAAEIEPEVETGAEAEAEPETGSEVQLESTFEIPAPESEPEHQRRFGLFRHETSVPGSAAEPEAAEPERATAVPEGEAEGETGSESTGQTPTEEPEPEPARHFHFFGPKVEKEAATAKSEAELESTAEIPASEPISEHHGHSHLFERKEKTPETEAESTFEIPAPESEPEHQRRFGLFRHETSEPGSETEPAAEPERATAVPEGEAEGETGSQSTGQTPTEEPEPEPARHFHFFGPKEEKEAATAKSEAELESTAEIPASEPISEHHGHSHLFERKEKTPETEAESADEIPVSEAESEHHRRFGLFRHETSEPGSAAEPAAEIEPEVDAGVEAEAEPEAGSEIQLESTFEISAPEAKPEHHRRFGLFRHETSEPGSETETEAESEPEVEAEAPNGERAPLRDSFWRRRVEEPGGSTNVGDATIEIDLPPEIPIAEIERTLEELGGREPGLRRHRWLRGASAEKDIATQSADDEALDDESELRLTAELERRQREREYLRNMRAPR